MTEPKTIEAVIDFSAATPPPEVTTVTPPRRVSAQAFDTTAWNHYSDPTQQFFAGVWAAGVGAMKVSYTEEELCYLLEGRARLTDRQGGSREFGPGSAFVIPAGFEGVWETLEPVRKIYAIWQPRAD
jgi:uncharacterized cupin superfamily protein